MHQMTSLDRIPELTNGKSEFGVKRQAFGLDDNEENDERGLESSSEAALSRNNNNSFTTNRHIDDSFKMTSNNLTNSSQTNSDNRAGSPRAGQGNCCAGCNELIKDKFIFSVIDLNFHQECVQCSDCFKKLNEKCFTYQNKLYCKLDYLKRFGPKCSYCNEVIEKSELVQRIEKENLIYHLKCFNCNDCQRQLKQGEQMHLLVNSIGKKVLLCKQDYNKQQQQYRSIKSEYPHQQQQQQQTLYNLTSGQSHSVATTKKRLACEDQQDESMVVEEDDGQLLDELDSDDGANFEEGEPDEDDDDEDDAEDNSSCDEAEPGSQLEGMRRLLSSSGFLRDDESLPTNANVDNTNLENEENHSGKRTSGAAKKSSSSSNKLAKLKRKRKRQKLEQRQQQQQSQGKKFGESILNGAGSSSILTGQAGPGLGQANSYQQQPKLGIGSNQSLSNHSAASSNPSSNSSSSGAILSHANHQHHQHQHQHQHHQHHHQRAQSGGGGGQKPTRVRTVLNEKQLQTLRDCYAHNPRPDALMKEQLVEMTGLSPRVIRVWFQNKRCKDKKKTILCKQMLQHEKDGRHFNGMTVLHGVQLVAASPIQYQEDQSTVSPGSGANQALETLQPTLSSPTVVGSNGTSVSQQRDYHSPLAPAQASQAEIQAYQPPWKNLIDYAQAHQAGQQQQQPTDQSPSERSLNAASPRYQQLMGQIHGYSAAQEQPQVAAAPAQGESPAIQQQPQFGQGYPPAETIAILGGHPHQQQSIQQQHLHQFQR